MKCLQFMSVKLRVVECICQIQLETSMVRAFSGTYCVICREEEEKNTKMHGFSVVAEHFSPIVSFACHAFDTLTQFVPSEFCAIPRKHENLILIVRIAYHETPHESGRKEEEEVRNQCRKYNEFKYAL